MEKLRTIGKEIWGIIGTSIADLRREHQIANRPAEFARDFLSRASLTSLAPLDSSCIWQQNRTRYDQLADSFLGRDLFANFFSSSTVTTVIPILTITQIGSSKSMGKTGEWISISDFGKSVYERNDLSCRDDLSGLLNHVLRGKNAIEVTHYQWSDEYVWNNRDGSHHFAVAYFHASKGAEVELPTTLTSISFDKDKYAKFLENGSLWVTHQNNYRNCISELKWKLRFTVQDYKYPIKDSQNVIFMISKNEYGIARLLKEYPTSFMPFEELFN